MQNELIWVTGASSGIGKEISIAFSRKGKNVIATARNREKLLLLKKEGGGKIDTAICDMSSAENISHFYAAFPQRDNISILVNNAGITSFTTAEEDSLELIEKVIATNLTGAIHAIKLVLPGMIKRKNGVIINILSVITQKIFTQSSIYSATKAGLMAYAKVLREEVRMHNIRVINVSPGATNTPIWSDAMREKNAHRMMDPVKIGELIEKISCLDGNLVVEDLVLRPPLGDL